MAKEKRRDHIGGIHHLGIAVKDIEASVAAISQALNFSSIAIRDVPERKIRVAFVHLKDGIELEFIQDDSENGRIAKSVRERGDYIHHFCLLTNNIEEDITILKERGVEMQDEEPRIGLTGKKIAYTKPSAINGIAFEILEN